MQIFLGFLLAAAIVDGIYIGGRAGLRPFVANAACRGGCRERRRARLVEKRKRRMLEEIQRIEKSAKCTYSSRLFAAPLNQCPATPAIMYADTYKMDLWIFYKNECLPKEYTLEDKIFAMFFFLFAVCLLLLVNLMVVSCAVK
jgi:hypothetical protein